jgi:hypothetical protein
VKKDVELTKDCIISNLKVENCVMPLFKSMLRALIRKKEHLYHLLNLMQPKLNST